MELKLTFNLLPVIGILISLLAWYIPGFKQWYEALSAQWKQLFMIILLFVVAVVVAALSAAGALHIYSGTTWQAFVFPALVDFVIALIANAGTYTATNRLLSGS